MKTFTFFTTCFIAIMCMGLTSCSKDDDEESDNIAIKGAWYSEEEEMGIVFDGKGSGYYYYPVDDDSEFTYKLNGNKLTITEKGDTYSVTIRVNGNTLKITEDGETATFKKADTEDE